MGVAVRDGGMMVAEGVYLCSYEVHGRSTVVTDDGDMTHPRRQGVRVAAVPRENVTRAVAHEVEAHDCIRSAIYNQFLIGLVDAGTGAVHPPGLIIYRIRSQFIIREKKTSLFREPCRNLLMPYIRMSRK